jgi:hypothetical protein
MIKIIIGLYNFRRVDLNTMVMGIKGKLMSSDVVSDGGLHIRASSFVMGAGMPSKNGIRLLLTQMNAGPSGSRTVYWTSLREEPVVFVKGRPHVLRLYQDPLKNVETTGIARERVEAMEVQMKIEIIYDLNVHQNKLLLHEEKVEDGKFVIVPVWHTVSIDEIETPRDIYDSIVSEGNLYLK